MTKSTKALRAALEYTCSNCHAQKHTELLPVKEVIERLSYECGQLQGRSDMLQSDLCSCTYVNRVASAAIGAHDGTFAIIGRYQIRIVFEGPYTSAYLAPQPVEDRSVKEVVRIAGTDINWTVVDGLPPTNVQDIVLNITGGYVNNVVDGFLTTGAAFGTLGLEDDYYTPDQEIET